MQDIYDKKGSEISAQVYIWTHWSFHWLTLIHVLYPPVQWESSNLGVILYRGTPTTGSQTGSGPGLTSYWAAMKKKVKKTIFTFDFFSVENTSLT